MMGACSTTAAPASQATLLVKEDPRWALWVLVVVALGILSIAVQEYRKDNRGEAFTWALLGLIAGGRGVWTLWRRRRTS